MPSSREHRFGLPGARRTRHGRVMPPSRKQSQLLMMEPPSRPLSCVSQQQLCSCSFCGLELPDNDSVPFPGIWVRNGVTAFLQEQRENLSFFQLQWGAGCANKFPKWHEMNCTAVYSQIQSLCCVHSSVLVQKWAPVLERWMLVSLNTALSPP